MSNELYDQVQEIKKRMQSLHAVPWRITTHNGGFRFDGPPVLYAGTNEEFGEPAALGPKEILSVHNRLLEDIDYLIDLVEGLW